MDIVAIVEGYYDGNVFGALLTMSDGSKWFHPYGGYLPRKV
jgi:hypothetical protein